MQIPKLVTTGDRVCSSRASDRGSIGSSVGGGLARKGVTSRSSPDSDKTPWKLFSGYQFNKKYGLERGRDRVGLPGLNLNFLVGGSGAWHANDVWTLAASGTLPLNERWFGFGKLGVAYSRVELNETGAPGGAPVSLSPSASHTQPVAALGLKYGFDDQFDVRGEFEHFKDLGNRSSTGLSEIIPWSTGNQYRF
jgi:hypothetical protein